MRKLLLLAVVLSFGACSNNGSDSGSTGKSPAKIKTITHGGTYAKSDYQIPGYVVILDFYNDQ